MYGLTRIPASGSKVIVRFTGLSGTGVIPLGTLVQDTNGVLYATDNAATVGVGGYVDVSCTCQITGEIYASANTVNKLYSALFNIDSCNNAAPQYFVGRPEETQQELTARIKNSVGANSLGSVQAVLGKIASLTGVVDVYALANFTTSTIVKDGITILPHCLYTAIYGGNDQDIFNALSKVVAGAGFTGNTTGFAQDESGLLAYYAVAFQRPTPQIIYFAVTIVSSVSLPANSTALTQAAIIESFNGLDGKSRAKIGSDLVGSRFIGNINTKLPTAEILSVYIGLSASPVGLRLLVPINAIPVTDTAYIAVNYV
jgi:hypothetical protein